MLTERRVGKELYTGVDFRLPNLQLPHYCDQRVLNRQSEIEFAFSVSLW